MKVLYSAQYGIGWSTQNESVAGLAQFMATYPPLMEAVAARLAEIKKIDSFIERRRATVIPNDHPVIKQMLVEIKDKFGLEEDRVCVLSSRNLGISIESSDAVRITEYDGLETVHPEYIDGLIFDPELIIGGMEKMDNPQES